MFKKCKKLIVAGMESLKDINSLNSSVFRSIGGEIAADWAFETLGFPGMLSEIGFE